MSEPVPGCSHRWLQFGLRTLLLCMLMVCVGLGYLAHRAKQYRRLVAELSALGVTVEFSTPPPWPQWIRTLVGDHLLGARYSATITGGVTDAQLKKLNELSQVDSILLGYSHSEVFAKVNEDLGRIRRELPQVQNSLVIKGDR